MCETDFSIFKRLNYLLNLTLHKTRPLHFVFQSFVNISVVDIFKYLRCTVCKQLFVWIFQICLKLFFFLDPSLSLASFSIFQLKSLRPKMKICQRTRSATQAKSRLTINFNLSAYYLQRNIKWNWIMRAKFRLHKFL